MRCNCGETTCAICNAPKHQPWTPKPGVTPPPPPEPTQEEIEAMMAAHRRWETVQSIKRYALVLLLIFVGGMVGGLFSAFTVLYYHP